MVHLGVQRIGQPDFFRQFDSVIDFQRNHFPRAEARVTFHRASPFVLAGLAGQILLRETQQLEVCVFLRGIHLLVHIDARPKTLDIHQHLGSRCLQNRHEPTEDKLAVAVAVTDKDFRHRSLSLHWRVHPTWSMRRVAVCIWMQKIKNSYCSHVAKRDEFAACVGQSQPDSRRLGQMTVVQ